MAVITLVLASTACGETRPAKTYVQAPPSVVASFTSFADSASPRVLQVLRSQGLHPGLDDKGVTGVDSPELHVRQLNESEAKARIYEASMMLKAHEHLAGGRGVAVPRVVVLEFSTIDEAEVWALITDQGYPFTLLRENHRNDLPLDTQAKVRDVFETRVEFADWVGFRRAKLNNVRGSPGAG